MSKKAAEHRRRASEHSSHAARHHDETAKQHEAGHHEKAAHHAHTATRGTSVSLALHTQVRRPSFMPTNLERNSGLRERPSLA